MKSYKHTFILVTILVLLIVLFVNQPSSIFGDQPTTGDVSLIRDDFELDVYYQRIGYFYDKEIPFQSDRVEYPVLGLFYLTIPTLLTNTQADYDIALIFQNIIFLIILVILTSKIIKILGRDNRQMWLFILPSILFFTINRFDIFPAVLIQLALLLILKKKYGWSFVLLSLSFLAKGYAMVLFPVFFVYYLVQRNSKIKGLLLNRPFLLFSIPAVIIVIGLMFWAGFENALFPYIFQSTRNFAYGSVYAIFISANWNFFVDGFWKWYMFIGSKILGVLQLVLPFIIYVGYKKFKQYIKTPTNLIMWSLLVLSFYIFLSPYYSPQWFLWLLPLLVLLPLNKKEVWLIIVYDLLNFIFFPVIYRYIGYESYIFDIVVFIRSLVFILILLMVVKKIYNQDNTMQKI
ncbi:MAG: hypothetical protein Q8P20_09180 [bacterium]|nr:hypothetical protein [bacterium]